MRERLLQDTEDREDEELVQQGDLAEAPQQAADPERLSRESDALEVNGFKWEDLEHPPEPADGHVIEVVVPVLVIRVGIRATFRSASIEKTVWSHGSGRMSSRWDPYGPSQG